MKARNKTSDGIDTPSELALIRKIAIIALFSDDVLLEHLVLKGGNAISMIYGIQDRTSIDIDMSLENDFTDFEEIKRRLIETLTKTFKERGYVAFDLDLTRKPRVVSKDKPLFWGGYELTFKIIEMEKFRKFGDDIRTLRTSAIPLGKDDRVTFKVDISKYEYCRGKRKEELDNYTIFVYTPEMIVLEKIRSICQQMKEYREIVPGFKGSPRARDFFDIYAVCWRFEIDLTTAGNIEILKNIFKAKNVPLELIGKIKDSYEYHNTDYPSLESTVVNRPDLKPFKFYFDYVVDLCGSLKPARDE